MWPFAKGSVQPIQSPHMVLRPKSWSSPQLTFSPQQMEQSRLSVFPRDRDQYKPQRCQQRLLSPDQLDVLKTLSDEEALCYLVGCLPGDTPKEQETTLATLLYTTYRWAHQNNFDHDKISVLLTLHFLTFKYVMASPWRTQAQTYSFFKESILRCSVQHSPVSERLLKPDECKASLLQFCHTFLSVLPLLRVTLLPNYRLQLVWKVSPEVLLQSQML